MVEPANKKGLDMKKMLVIAMFAIGVLTAQAVLVVDMTGNWNTSSSGTITYTLPWTTNGNAVMMNSSFVTPILTNGKTGTGGSYQGPTLYGAFRQYTTTTPTTPVQCRAGYDDRLNCVGGGTASIVGDLEWMYVVKKADFVGGLTGNLGFDSTCNFSITGNTWTAASKVLRAVVQNGSTWYISAASNTVDQSGAKIFTDASSMLWSVWDPTTETGLSGSELDFSTTVAGSTFTDIQAVGFWSRFTDNAATTPSATISGIQIGVVVVPEPVTVGMLGLGALVTLVFRRMRNN